MFPSQGNTLSEQLQAIQKRVNKGSILWDTLALRPRALRAAYVEHGREALPKWGFKEGRTKRAATTPWVNKGSN